ncbi:peptidase U32 [Caldicellulosiruptor saccharolyticus DSM 8903]|uniref:Peptidase U32 n=1 Tax=Caldicellulosiruptor saccharolyticus (strain ATCC 43494 / DSM 8903 / Tp8T 6331) TaxID=351627 RepID=A4XGQ2_CALS8|nr:U32 family peptidase [Caldicellulosiruptor saccharolyticus]ABP66087.1 peptidase U32 [Caldicellulosiruptor saccharolyticus DSM 8903]
MKKVELLSPAGGFEELISAIQAGADGVYVGAKEFSARAYAKNFSEDELIRAINYCHERGKKIYLAVNTLIYDEEIDRALRLLEIAYKEGIDAVIVQDLGLLSIIKKEFADLPIHASTQMTIHNLLGAKVLSRLGVKRVVLARELNISEIKNIKKSADIEIEVFVHGALCISYSGQCLFSSILFKRSGNRGQCAQPCRLYYKLLNKDKKIVDRGYLLSPRDICLLDYIPNLIEAGVDSFKIEGRLKDKYYVYTVTSIYRKYIDMYYQTGKIEINQEDRNKLFLVFNRGNFSKGYLDNPSYDNLIFKSAPNNTGLLIGSFYFKDSKLFIKTSYDLTNGDVIAFRSEKFEEVLFEINNNISKYQDGRVEVDLDFARKKVLKNASNGKVFLVKSKQLEDEGDQILKNEKKFRKVDFEVTIKRGENIKAVAKTGFFEAHATGPVPEEAKSKPTTYQNVLDSFSKLGNTIFDIGELKVYLDDNVFVKLSDLNSLRKELIEKLSKSITCSFKRSVQKPVEILYCSKKDQNGIKKAAHQKFSFVIDSFSQYQKVKEILHSRNIGNFDIYVPYTLIFNHKFSDNDIVYFDRITHDNDLEKINLKALREKGFKKVLIRNLGQYELLKDQFDLCFDFSFNVTNSFAADLIKNLGAKRLCLSVELSKQQIEKIRENSPDDLEIETVVFWKIPLMVNKLKFFEKGSYLQDRKGELLELVSTQTMKNEILNPVALYIDDKEVPADVIRFDFTACSDSEIAMVFEKYFDGKVAKLKLTKGYY